MIKNRKIKFREADYIEKHYIKDGKAIIPSGDDYIVAGDNVVVVTTNQYLDDLKDILE